MDIRKTGPQQNYFLQHAKPQKPREKTLSIMDSVSVGEGLTGDKTAKPWQKEWTLLFYSAADNDLKKYLIDDVNQMEAVGSTTQMNLVVQLDKGENCRRYYLERDTDPKNIRSRVVEDMGPVNMSDPGTLSDFIKFGMKKYPAKHYALIISDHGEAWKGAVEDESHHGWMTTPQIRQGIMDAQKETGNKLDVLGFDACLMANTEVAHELRDTATYLVASQEVEGANGWPYTPLLDPDKLEMMDEALKQKANITPRLLSEAIVEIGKTDQDTLPTLSAVDLSKVENLTRATDNFAQALIDTDTSGALLQKMSASTENFTGFKDHYHFASKIARSFRVKDKALKESARAVMEAVKDAVIAEQHSENYPNANGLTLEIPTYGPARKGYHELAFAKETKWDEALSAINAKAKMEGITAQKIECPKIEKQINKYLELISQVPVFEGLKDMAESTDFARVISEKMGTAENFEELACEPNFARDKGVGVAGLLGLMGLRGMIDLEAGRQDIYQQSTMLIDSIVDDGKLAGINSSIMGVLIQVIQSASEAQMMGSAPGFETAPGFLSGDEGIPGPRPHDPPLSVQIQNHMNNLNLG